MKESIYTIPVNEAFRQDSECPMCILEKKCESEYIDYFLGPSLMEPDCRCETNDKGFCRNHFELLYNQQENRLGLGLVVDTHLGQQMERIKKIYEAGVNTRQKQCKPLALKSIADRLASKRSETKTLAEEIAAELESLENKCAVCSRVDYTMDRYMDVILYLWSQEDEFKSILDKSKGLCLKHLKKILQATGKHLKPAQAVIFIQNLMDNQLRNMERIQEEVRWFTQKFDYRNHDAPWGNSQDALPRGIQKIVGFIKTT